jgi:hypothetical protein
VAKCYRSIWIPEKDGIKEIMAGIASVGDSISKNIYEELISNEKINESLGPKTLKRMFLTEDFVDVKTIYDTFLRTPGEIRIKDKAVLKDCINNGVSSRDFGLGKLVDGKPDYVYWDQNCPVAIESGEILINPERISAPDAPDVIDPPTIKCTSCGIEFISDGNDKCLKCRREDPPPPKKEHLIITTNLPQSESYRFTEFIPWLDRSFKNIQIRIVCEDGEISVETIARIKKILHTIDAQFDVK